MAFRWLRSLSGVFQWLSIVLFFKNIKKFFLSGCNVTTIAALPGNWQLALPVFALLVLPSFTLYHPYAQAVSLCFFLFFFFVVAFTLLWRLLRQWHCPHYPDGNGEVGRNLSP